MSKCKCGGIDVDLLEILQSLSYVATSTCDNREYIRACVFDNAAISCRDDTVACDAECESGDGMSGPIKQSGTGRALNDGNDDDAAAAAAAAAATAARRSAR